MSVATKSRLKVTRYGGYVGAILSGVNLSRPQDEETWAAIRQAFDEHGVIFFHDQKLDFQQLTDFGRQLGELAIGNGRDHPPGFDHVQLMIKEPSSKMGAGDIWHVDQSFRAHPTRGTVLHAVEIPPFGGDTLFLSAAAAFDALPEAQKAILRTMQAVHARPWIVRDQKFHDHRKMFDEQGWKGVDGASKLDDVAVHPVVKRHPGTGREILFINPGYTCNFVGWTEAESAPLLKQLFDHCQQPEFQCRFKWSVGALACWDNRQVWHYAANDYHGHRREMHRLMVQ